jgi:hypothetical protein
MAAVARVAAGFGLAWPDKKPTVTFRLFTCRVVQLVAHQILDLGVLGSSPSAAAFSLSEEKLHLQRLQG